MTSLFRQRPSMLRVKPSHFSSQSFPLFQVSLSHLLIFRVRPYNFFESVLLTFPSTSFLDLTLPNSFFLEGVRGKDVWSVLPNFRVSPSHSFFPVSPSCFLGGSDLPIFLSQAFHFVSQFFPFFESDVPILFTKLLFN